MSPSRNIEIKVRAEDLPEVKEAFGKLRELIADFAQHDSWRCDHPPHYYLAGGPPDDGDCACGLLSALAAAGIDPEPWRPRVPASAGKQGP